MRQKKNFICASNFFVFLSCNFELFPFSTPLVFFWGGGAMASFEEDRSYASVAEENVGKTEFDYEINCFLQQYA